MRLFVYLSELLGKKVCDSRNHVLGKVVDISIYLNEEVFPRAQSIVLKRGLLKPEYANVSLDNIAEIGEHFILKVKRENIPFQSEAPKCDFSLCRDILDQQVVDTDDQKVVRVNDVHLLQIDNQMYLAHVDIGLRGLIRRLGWEPAIDWVIRRLRPDSLYLKHEELLSWKNTQALTIGSKNVLRSNMARQKLARIPATELAEILEDLDVFERLSLFKTFHIDMQRRVFTDMAPHEKEELIDLLEDREAGNLLENIPADEATDLLHDLPQEKRMNLLKYMHSQTSKHLRKLLGFAQDSAGGLMTTEYLSLEENALVQDALQKIKDNVDYPGNIFFVYIVDDRHRLVGTTSLRRFINADPQKPLMETCYSKQIFVRTDDGVEEVALLLEKYKFSSIAVLNEDNVMQGVITSDDVMEELISLAWKKYKDQL